MIDFGSQWWRVRRLRGLTEWIEYFCGHNSCGPFYNPKASGDAISSQCRLSGSTKNWNQKSADVKCLHWCQRYSTVQHPITWLAYSNHNTSVVKWLRCKNQEKSVLTVYLHVIYDYSWFGNGISFLRLDMPNFQKNEGSFGNFWEILNHYIWNI